MDLNLARTFVRVVDAGSFTSAARAAALPKSSVSRAIARLEEDLGVRLLDRSTRHLLVTPAGRAYYDGARAAVAALDEAERAVTELQGEPRGLVRVTVPGDIDRALYAHVIARFLDENPGIGVLTSITNRVVDLASEGFDVALRAGRIADDSLVARRIGEDSSELYAAPAYLAAHGHPRSPAELPHHRWVLYRTDASSATVVLDGPPGRVSVEVSGRSGGDDLGYVRELVIRGHGIARLPTLIARADLAEGRLARVLPDWSGPGSALWIVTASRQVPRRVALLRDYLAVAFAGIVEAMFAARPGPKTRPKIKSLTGSTKRRRS